MTKFILSVLSVGSLLACQHTPPLDNIDRRAPTAVTEDEDWKELIPADPSTFDGFERSLRQAREEKRKHDILHACELDRKTDFKSHLERDLLFIRLNSMEANRFEETYSRSLSPADTNCLRTSLEAETGV